MYALNDKISKAENRTRPQDMHNKYTHDRDLPKASLRQSCIDFHRAKTRTFHCNRIKYDPSRNFVQLSNGLFYNVWGWFFELVGRLSMPSNKRTERATSRLSFWIQIIRLIIFFFCNGNIDSIYCQHKWAFSVFICQKVVNT